MASSRFSVAIHTLALLATHGEKPLKSDFIACLVKTNAVVIRRLLSDLARAEIVVSQAGACGGTKLAKNPREICLYEVYRAVESGQVFALHRHSPDKKCGIGRNIEAVLCQVQTKLDVAIEKSLDQICLEDILQMINAEQLKLGESGNVKDSDCLS
ncbi:MAG: Rrf2 family transcriptional regulator [Pyrinomonadaceae bacterium]|nr:Rrf2 family transcriptional regulator [Pyrinomonadaceae bacterium]